MKPIPETMAGIKMLDLYILSVLNLFRD